MTIERASDNPFPSVLFRETVDPANPASGDQRLFVDTDHLLKLRDSAGTVVTFPTSAGLTDPMTTRGDIIVRNASNVTARLATGTATYVLTSDGTDVAWAAPTAAPTLASASYIRTSANYTTTSTTFVDVDGTNLALAITTGARKVMIGVTASASNSGTNNVFLDLLVDGTSVSGGVGVLLGKTVGANDPSSFTWLTAALSAASHTFKLQWKTAAGTATLYGGQAGGPVMQMWVGETLYT